MLATGVRAELVRRLGDAGLRRIEVGELRRPAAGAADGRRRGGRRRERPRAGRDPQSGWCSTRAATTGCARHRLPRGATSHSCVTDDLQPAQPGPSTVEQSLATADAGRRRRPCGRATASRSPSPRPSAARSRARSTRRARGRARRAAPRRGPTRSRFADTIGVGVPVAGAGAASTRLARPPASRCGVALPQHPQHRLRQRATPRSRRGVDACWTPALGGHGRLPVRARTPPATSRPRTSLYLLEREGVDTGVDLDRLLAVSQWVTDLLGRDLPGQLLRAGTFG